MGVKGAKNKKQQEKWNKFVSLLIENAGLPSTCLVRLIFMNAEGQKYEINNYQDLKQLSSTYGDKTITINYITMHISIEVLALTFKQYQKRFKYEQDEYMKLHNIQIPKNNQLTQQHKQLLSKFVLPPLITTKAIIQKKIKNKPPSSTEPPSSSPSIMDMLHVNQPINNKPVKNEEDNPVINDLLENVINVKEPEPILVAKKEPESSSQPPPEPQPSPQVHVQQPVVSEAAITSILNQPKRKLATIYKHSPLISFEEFRYKHYMEKKQWEQEEDEEEEEDVNDNVSVQALPNLNKLMIFNWPIAMNKDTLKTIFSSHGTVINAEVSEQFAFVEYEDNESSKRAIAALNGFQIGHNQLNVTYYILQKPDKEDNNDDDIKQEPKPEDEEETEEEEQEENRKLVIGNWPQSMGDGLLKTLFSPYGELLNAKIVNECGIIEYVDTESAEKAAAQLNGFQMGANKLVVSFASDQLSHILNMENNEESAEEQPEIEPEVEPKEEVDDFEDVGYPANDQNEVEVEPEPVEEPKKSIFEEIEEVQQDLTVVIKEQKVDQTPTENEIEQMVQKENDNNNLQQILHDDVEEEDEDENDVENGDEEEEVIQQQLMNENKMRAQSMNINTAQNVDKKQDYDDKVSHKRSQSEPHKIENAEQDKQEESESDEDDESTDLSSSDSDNSESSSTSSSFEEKFRRKYSKKKLSKKQLKRLKKKEKLKRKRRQKRKKNKKLKRREKYVDRNISALNECLEKFTNLMSSVSQSAMVMQQSVAQMSQLHAQQQQQSMIYQQSMRSIFPNQPLYTSIIPQANNTNNANIAQQPGTQQTNGNQDISQSMQNVINQMSITQGGPDTNNSANMNVSNSPISNNMNTTPKMNVMTQDMLNQQLIQQQQQLLRQQQLIQQQAMQLQQPQNQQQQKIGQKSSAWVNTNYAKPVLNNNRMDNNNKNNGIPSSPILHSTHYSPQSGQPSKIGAKAPVFNMLYNGNSMNLSGDSNNEPGNNNNSQSKSKIFEHKKALRNVSPEMEEKLTELNKMGYTNRTFNLVLLKQENGDMTKVIENLKQFYKNN